MRNILLTLISIFCVTLSYSQLSVTSLDTEYTIDFDNTVSGVNNGQYNGSGFNTSPSTGQLDGNAWMVYGFAAGGSPVTQNFDGSSTAYDHIGGTHGGGTSHARLYAFTVGGASDVAFGVNPTAGEFTPGYFKLKVTNNTGEVLNSATIDYEAWIYNNGGRSNSIKFSYSTDDSSYINVDSADLTSPAAADGSPSWSKTDKSLSASLGLADGSSFYLKWTYDEVGGSGDRDEFAIDDIKVSVTGAYSSSQSGNWSSTSTWDSGVVPTSSDVVVISSGNFVTVDASSDAKSIVVESGGYLLVNNLLTLDGDSGSADSSFEGTVNVTGANAQILFTSADLSVSGALSVAEGKQIIFASSSSQISNSGDITLNSDSDEFSALIYTGSAYSGSGDFNYARYITTAAVGWDLIGSPVSGATAANIINQGNLANNGSDYGIGPYDNSSESDNTSGYGSWSTYDFAGAFSEGVLESAKGFQMASDNGSTIDFVGALLTDDATYTVTEGDNDGDAASEAGTRFNLLSNPYPSYLSVNSNASGASTYGSDHVLNASNLAMLHTNNQAIYVWGGTSNGYTTINSATSAANAVIAPGQGFMVGGSYSVNDASSVFTITNSMITEDGTDDGIQGDINFDDRGEVFVMLSQNEFQRITEIYFLENTTDSFEPLYDATAIGFNYPSINSRLVIGDEGNNFSIQSLAYSEMWDKVIPLGINALGGEEMTISISHRTTPADLNIYLEDTEEGTMTNLLDGDFVYTPTSDLEGVGRFFIHMTADTMSNEEVSTSMLNAYKEIDASYITIEGLATQTNETKVSLYNILGREVLSATLNNNMGTQTISTVGLSAGIYVIELESGTDRLTKKLLIQ